MIVTPNEQLSTVKKHAHGFYGTLQRSRTSDKQYCRVSLLARYLLDLLQTGELSTTLPGLTHTRMPVLAAAYGYTVEQLESCLAELEHAGLVQLDRENDIQWVPCALASTEGSSKTGKGYERLLASIPDCKIKADYLAALKERYPIDTLSIPYRYPIDTLSIQIT